MTEVKACASIRPLPPFSETRQTSERHEGVPLVPPPRHLTRTGESICRACARAALSSFTVRMTDMIYKSVFRTIDKTPFVTCVEDSYQYSAKERRSNNPWPFKTAFDGEHRARATHTTLYSRVAFPTSYMLYTAYNGKQRIDNA